MLAHGSCRPVIAGTNFLIRSSAFSECGWMPEYTLTEDYALGMELKMRKWQVRRQLHGAMLHTPRHCSLSSVSSSPLQSCQWTGTSLQDVRPQTTAFAFPRDITVLTPSCTFAQCRYVPEYLAVGEAPEQVRNCFQQRSRWCKGHYQVIFSRQHCPLLQRRLSFLMKARCFPL